MVLFSVENLKITNKVHPNKCNQTIILIYCDERFFKNRMPFVAMYVRWHTHPARTLHTKTTEGESSRVRLRLKTETSQTIIAALNIQNKFPKLHSSKYDCGSMQNKFAYQTVVKELLAMQDSTPWSTHAFNEHQLKFLNLEWRDMWDFPNCTQVVDELNGKAAFTWSFKQSHKHS